MAKNPSCNLEGCEMGVQCYQVWVLYLECLNVIDDYFPQKNWMVGKYILNWVGIPYAACMVYLPTFRCGCVGCQRHVAFSGCVNFKKRIKLRIPWEIPPHKLGPRLSFSLCFPLINGRYTVTGVNSPCWLYGAPCHSMENNWLPWRQWLKVTRRPSFLKEVMIWTITLKEGFFNPKTPLDRKKSHHTSRIHGDERYIYPVRNHHLPWKSTIHVGINIPNSSHWMVWGISFVTKVVCIQSLTSTHRNSSALFFFPTRGSINFCRSTKPLTQSLCFPLEVPKMHQFRSSVGFSGTPPIMGPP